MEGEGHTICSSFSYVIKSIKRIKKHWIYIDSQWTIQFCLQINSTCSEMKYLIMHMWAHQNFLATLSLTLPSIKPRRRQSMSGTSTIEAQQKYIGKLFQSLGRQAQGAIVCCQGPKLTLFATQKHSPDRRDIPGEVGWVRDAPSQYRRQRRPAQS